MTKWNAEGNGDYLFEGLFNHFSENKYKVQDCQDWLPEEKWKF
jgi:hypothetical protein